ncbi:MAG: cation-translocating P-type ATPase [Candidatus Peregrinibacteria bacterium]
MSTPQLDERSFQGLTAAEAASRLQAEGFNELPSSRKRTFLRIAFDVAKEPMLLLLLGCGSAYLLLGDRQEGFLLLGSIFLVIGITLYQERKTMRALEALRDLSSPRALVIRDGQTLRIPGREVVRGDYFIVSEGDRIPADGTVLSCMSLSVNESLLTGEAVPVRKVQRREAIPEAAQPGGDDHPFVFSGTLVVSGRGVCKATSTGMQTAMGAIGKTLQSLENQNELSLVQKEGMRIVRVISILGAILCAIIIGVYGWTEGKWIEGFLVGISVAISLLPEEITVVLTIFFAIGAWRISKRGVLTRRIPAVELLGATTVLCTDKTGTITFNRMAVQEIASGNESFTVAPDATNVPFPETFHEAMEYAILASHRDPFDPMEQAIQSCGEKLLSGTEHIHSTWMPIKEYPLSPALLAMSVVWRSPDESEYIIASKGSPEAAADLCHLEPEAWEKIRLAVDRMTTEGLRVLGIATARYSGTLPEGQHDVPFRFVGLVGFADPMRPTVPTAVQECATAGIRVIMITGDHPNTAAAIARQAGILTDQAIITGPEIDAMSDVQLQEAVRSVRVFARTVPNHKLRLVNALRANGEIVAMTGDGVNDAPALKASHIGIAMGLRGTDVAREAADLVLLDDDFSSIVNAIRSGRRIFENLRKAMSYIVAIHVPIAGLALVPVLLDWPLILLPVHIVFLELIIDPACSVVFEMEEEEEGIMRRPPHDSSQPTFSASRIRLSVFQGLGVFIAAFSVYAWAILHGETGEAARTLAFIVLIIGNLGLILTNRSWVKSIPASFRVRNSSVWWMLGGAGIMLSLIITVPVLISVFHFARLSLAHILPALIAGCLSILWFEIFKLIRLRSHGVDR